MHKRLLWHFPFSRGGLDRLSLFCCCCYRMHHAVLSLLLFIFHEIHHTSKRNFMRKSFVRFSLFCAQSFHWLESNIFKFFRFWSVCQKYALWHSRKICQKTVFEQILNPNAAASATFFICTTTRFNDFSQIRRTASNWMNGIKLRTDQIREACDMRCSNGIISIKIIYLCEISIGQIEKVTSLTEMGCDLLVRL